MAKIKVGLYGTNGHQIQNALVDHRQARLWAVASFDPEALPPELRGGDVKMYDSLDQMLVDPAIELVSLCSPSRADQAKDTVKALEAGKHVYAEKPSALTEQDLDRIVAAAAHSGVRYHEQAATVVEQPYCTLRRIVESGALGKIVQIYAQKSYPWHDKRPQDERIDGGLAVQVGVYVARFVEHVAGMKIKSLTLKETKLGNPVADGGCHRAVSMLIELENGGVASGVANYLCPGPESWGKWGYETLRIWGVNGFVESIDGGRIGNLALVGGPCEAVDFSTPAGNYLDMFIDEIQTGQRVIPFSLEQELSPTRWVIRGKQEAGH